MPLNLNAESHFAESPLGVGISRSTFDRSCGTKGTYNAGLLNCCFFDYIYPGDTVDLKTSELVRMTTPVFPVMDDCFLDVYYFFVPMRLVWEHTKQFFGENDVSSWTPSTVYTNPQIDLSNCTRTVGDFAHQIGIPYTIGNSSNALVDALPFRAYRKIWNEWFRDQNTQNPLLVSTGDTETDYTYNQLLPVCRVHDYFGSALPGTQKGNAVNIALSTNIPVYATGTRHDVDPSLSALTWKANSGSAWYDYKTNGNIGVNLVGDTVQNTGTVTPTTTKLAPDNLYAIGGNSAINVNDLRLAVQTQKILEKLSIGGSRYTEFIRSMFGVVSPDARQQRPELLVTERVHLRMNEVTQSAPTVSGQTPIGTVGGWSKTVGSGAPFSKSFTEHGFLFGLFCIRHNRSYSQGINKQFYRKNMLDFYVPALAHIGEQPIYKKELYAGANPNDVFGYQEAWAELRYKPSINTGLLDPAVPNSIGTAWTYGDLYASAPSLSGTWMEEGSSEIARTLAVSGEDQFICDFWFDYKHTRCMPVYSVPGLVDHF